MTIRGGWHSRHMKNCSKRFDAEGQQQQQQQQQQQKEQPSTSAQHKPATSAQEQPSTSAQPHTSSSSESRQNVDTGALPEVDELGRVVCRNCGQYFAKVGGWHTKHVLYCGGENARNRQVNIIS
jgi:hypothetical protein